MTIPLQRLREFEHTTPGPGQISLTVARHQSAVWPSAEVTAYADHRSQLIHRLVDDTGVTVVSWGETDGQHPREVVEVVLAVVPAAIGALGVVLAAWISRPKRNEPLEPAGPKPPPDTNVALPGISLRRHDGTQLQVTYRDDLKPQEIQRLVGAFLEDVPLDESRP